VCGLFGMLLLVERTSVCLFCLFVYLTSTRTTAVVGVLSAIQDLMVFFICINILFKN